MKTPITLGSLAAIIMLGSGCVSQMAESPYKTDVQPSARTIEKRPYRIEEVYVASAADPTRGFEVAEKELSGRGFFTRLLGWLYGINIEGAAQTARVQKEMIQDRLEATKICAAAAFDVDEKEVKPTMVAFWQSIPRLKSEAELTEMGMPEYHPSEEEGEPEEMEFEAAALAPTMLAMYVGNDVLNADSLTEILSEKYPDLFSDNGKPVRIVIGVMHGLVNLRSQYGYTSDNYMDFGIWAWSATSPFGKNDPFPLPSAEFSAVYHTAHSYLVPASVRRSSEEGDFVKGSEKETHAFMVDRLCAAIVEAINNMPDKQFGGIR